MRRSFRPERERFLWKTGHSYFQGRSCQWTPAGFYFTYHTWGTLRAKSGHPHHESSGAGLKLVFVCKGKKVTEHLTLCDIIYHVRTRITVGGWWKKDKQSFCFPQPAVLLGTERANKRLCVWGGGERAETNILFALSLSQSWAKFIILYDSFYN